MKKYVSFLLLVFMFLSCDAQHKDTKDVEKEKLENTEVQPKGSWKVDKEFDENGNLIRYDSIYTWSSSDNLKGLSSLEKDSLLRSFESKFFKHFSHFENQGFDDVFSSDSLFSKRFFNDDFFGSSFGKDFMDIDKIRQQMIARQKQFLEKYHKEFIKPEDDQN